VKRTAQQGIEAGRFDGLKLAAHGEALAGELDLAKRTRIADRLAPGADRALVAWSIEGGHDSLERPMLTVKVRGRLPLVCQRCLQTLEASIDQRSELLLARDDAELARLDADEREVVLASAPLDATTLVEDELLLTLPFAPMHAKAQCPAGPEPRGAGEEPNAPSPFARLAALRKGRGGISEE